MRKLLVGIIKFAGRQLQRLGEIHHKEAELHLTLAAETAERLEHRADELCRQADQVKADGRKSSRKSREESARCLAVAQVVKSIN